MTVENTSNKQTAQQMGTLYEYEFTFDILLKDPTATEAMQAIKAIVTDADGVETKLEYGTDYTVTLNSDRSGGHITVVDKKTSDYTITIYREHTLKQEADYQDFNASPAETFEQCFDKLTMLEQQQQEEIDRCVKVGMTSSVDPVVLVEQVERIYESIDNVDTVADIADDVQTVADNDTNITTVAGVSNDVTTVAGIASDVTTVAGIASNVSAVGENISDVSTCATNISDIQTACGSLVYYGDEEPSDSYKLWIDPNGDSDPHFTSTLKTKIDGIEAGAQVNVIEDVKVNGVSLTVSDKAVDVTVPTDTNDLANGAGFLVASDISGKQDKNQAITTLSGTSITLADNSINTLTPSGNTTFTLPAVSDTTVFHQILVQLDLSTVYTIDLGTTTYFGGSAPDLSAAGNYNLIYEYDNALSAWVVGSISKGV